METTAFILADGRRLAYVEVGDPNGAPAIYCHGFPSSGRESCLLEAAARECGMRVIGIDRPGYGGSDPLPGRRLLDWPDDVLALADRLGLERWDVIGVSGGGPYALACAARFAHTAPGRLGRCLLVAPLGPLYRPDVLRAMRPAIRLSFGAAQRAPGAADRLFARPLARVMALTPGVVAWVRRANANGADRAVLRQPAVGRLLDRSVADAMRSGARGARQDLSLYTQPWGFDPAGLDHPVELWHGDGDHTVPLAHGQWYARHLPRARLRVLPGEGHYSLPVRYAAAILRGIR